MSALPCGIYLVLDADVCTRAGHDPAGVAVAAVRAGVGTVQVRAKRAGVRDLVALTVAVADALRGSPPAALVVDDRVDVALAARARGARVDGVHVGRHDLETADARALLGPDALVGVSAARPEHMAAAVGADHVGSGPVRLTPTKPEAGPAIGFDGLRAAVVAADGRPVVAIGGLGAADAPALRAAGVHAMAVVSAVCAAPDPGGAAARLVAAWQQVPAVAR
ncbi:Thiamine-phosphate diphosphorylase [Cellulomonas flavigena DSM 20109]|uniref:Thiamine-phosphate synthase n=1 Tax=Cellulomonas flavigena (strain ATCC 482 / DSM 20109 / BCRC 11376 / JCM 18109 / NBRC 3775 / NCIMB 8073 / NRS 134) TaxID=446466 RepID=D5UDX5_CELFN|nr:thiamine phosphate synthase [Cellulomonas flavigena]ADG74533.1 Thiamine-phosphate diphosphorylase [Cellulomonas flavigena DSM 20109]